MTYSIVARDPDSKQMGVATQSQAFAVGSSVPWAEPGFGVVATQSVAEPFYGELGLDLLRGGLTADEALRAMQSVDPHPERRQVAMVDERGGIAVYTGDGCVAEAGHLVGNDCVALANMMATDTVWEAMVRAYETTRAPLAYRMLAALEAAEAEGGDLRGRRSAAITVVRAARTGRPWQDRIVDLRVDEHDDPVRELRRLVEFSETYHLAVRGFEQSIDGVPGEALATFEAIHDRVHDEPDHLMRLGLSQVAVDRIDDARATFAELATCAPNFIELVRRFPEAGILAEHVESLHAALPEEG